MWRFARRWCILLTGVGAYSLSTTVQCGGVSLLCGVRAPTEVKAFEDLPFDPAGGFANPEILRYETPDSVCSVTLRYIVHRKDGPVCSSINSWRLRHEMQHGMQFNPGTRGDSQWTPFAGNGRVLGFGVLPMAYGTEASAYLA